MTTVAGIAKTPELPAFATSERLAAATEAARRLRAEQPQATPFFCADVAVRQVFGTWILNPDRSVRRAVTPVVDQLIARVERLLVGN